MPKPKLNPHLVGALVRIGMCDISATVAEAHDALDSFFRATGSPLPSEPSEQLAKLRVYIAACVEGHPPAAAGLPTVIMPPTAGADAQDSGANAQDRAEAIVGIVALSKLTAGHKLELASELLEAKGANGQPIPVGEAISRVAQISAEH